MNSPNVTAEFPTHVFEIGHTQSEKSEVSPIFQNEEKTICSNTLDSFL